ncbi:MAG: hypothetical protein ACOC2C_01715 [Cyclonatronaceae bacterium]
MNTNHAASPRRDSAGTPLPEQQPNRSRRHFLKQLAGLGAGGLLLMHGLYGCSDTPSGPGNEVPDVEKPEVPAGLSGTVTGLMQAYIDRVYDRGGRIISVDKLAAELVFLETEGLLGALHSAFLPYAGFQASSETGPVSRWFNVLEQGDGIQSDESLRPALEDGALRFNGKVMRFESQTASLLRVQPGQNFTMLLLADIQSGNGYALSVAERFEILMNASNEATPRFNLNGSNGVNISRAGTSQGGPYLNTLVYDGARPDEADFYFNNVFERSFNEFSAGEAGSADTPLFLGGRSESDSGSLQMRLHGFWLFDRALQAEEIAAFSLFKSGQVSGMGWHPGGYPELEDEEIRSYLETLHRAGGYLRQP